MGEFTWCILTAEYPPAKGGVGDYTAQLAEKLAETDQVIVFVLGTRENAIETRSKHLTIRYYRGYHWRTLSAIERRLHDVAGEGCILLQYCGAFGARGMNLPFCMWLRRLKNPPLWTMMHEVAVLPSMRRSIGANILAAVTHATAFVVLSASQKIFVSTSAWIPRIQFMRVSTEQPIWLPVPSNIPAVDRESPYCRQIHRVYAKDDREILIGHFGTYWRELREQLTSLIVRAVLPRPGVKVILMGRGCEAYADKVVEEFPKLKSKIVAVGELPVADLAAHIGALDIAIQPYPDGITTRRTTAMASLSQGVPVLTTVGPNTEAIWKESGAVALLTPNFTNEDIQIVNHFIHNKLARLELGRKGLDLYKSRFSIAATTETLKRTVETSLGCNAPKRQYDTRARKCDAS